MRSAAAVLVCFLLACATTHGLDREIRSRHPGGDAPLSAEPEPGYVPTGVFRVRGPRATLYLAGTSHVVDRSQLPFPSTFYAAYRDSAAVYMEIDPGRSAFQNVGLGWKVVSWVTANRSRLECPDGTRLGDHLAPETLDALRDRYGEDFANDRRSPAFLVVSAAIGTMQPKEHWKRGVEDEIRLFVRRDRKPLRELDGAELDETTLAMLDDLLSYAERDIAARGADVVVRESLLADTADIDAAWRHGDLAAIERIQVRGREMLGPSYEAVVPARNRSWMEKLRPLLEGSTNTLVLVGAGHLGGEDGLLDLLRAAGYTPEQTYGIDRPALDPARSD